MSKLTMDTLQSLAANHEPCPIDHSFLRDHGIPTPVGRQLADVIVADNDCSGAFAVPLRKDEGDVVNAAIYLPVTSGVYHQAFVPGAPLSGAFARFGDVHDQVYVTVDVHTAAVLHYSTGEACVAALWAENLEPACNYFAAKKNAPAITLAMDGQDDALAMHGQPVYTATELAAQRGWPLVTSGASETFQALLHAKGKSAVLGQLANATVPSWQPKVSISENPGDFDTLPATQPQNGSSLLHDLKAAVQRSLIVTRAEALAVALWIMFTYVAHRSDIAPILAALSPAPRCGKTVLLTLASRLAHRTLAASNMTEASIYRCIQQWNTTLLIDEADTGMVSNKSLVGILNSGYKRSTGYVLRAGKEGVERLRTFGPKAIALIGDLPPTLHDRAIPIHLERKLPTQTVHPVNTAGPDDLTILKARLLRWARDNVDTIADVKPKRLGLKSDRAEDNCAPLLAIAQVIGEPWLQRTRESLALVFDCTQTNDSDDGRLLTDIKQAFAAHGEHRITTADLLKRLNALDEAPWPHFSHGRPMTARDLAQMLRRYGVHSLSIRKGDSVARGFQLEQFQQAFARYAPTATPAHATPATAATSMEA